MKTMEVRFHLFSATALAKCSPMTSEPTPTSAAHCALSPWPCCSSNMSGPPCSPQASLPPSPPAILILGIISEVPRPGPFWCCLPALFQHQHSNHPTACIFHSLTLFAAQDVSSMRVDFCFLSCVPSA